MKRSMQLLPFITMFLFTAQLHAQQIAQWLDKLDVAQYENKVLYLGFWTSWCGPCRKSFPWLNSMQEKYRDKGLVVIGVNLDSELSTAKQSIKRVPANFLLYADPGNELAEKYKLTGIPGSYLLSGDGQLRAHYLGFKESKAQLYEADIVKLLNQLADNQKENKKLRK